MKHIHYTETTLKSLQENIWTPKALLYMKNDKRVGEERVTERKMHMYR